MKEIDAHFDAYEHLKELPREAEALHTLRKAASIVKPLMRKRGWKVGTLCEFLPPDPRLQGLNINKTERICIRLRFTPDPRQFIPLENVIDTLLHELSHIIWGPHNHNFQTLWNELRGEYQILRMKGYTGEGFLSAGRKLGGKRIPNDELRRQVRAAAAERQKQSHGRQGHRVGGTPGSNVTDMRKAMADAASRRTEIAKGCASGTEEGQRLAKDASKNGFRTKAEEDDANDAAIAIALVELYEAEEGNKLQEEEATISNDQDGLIWSSESGLQAGRSASLALLEPFGATESVPSTQSDTSSLLLLPITHQAETLGEGHASNIWSCLICTLDNPMDYLACDACGSERPTYISSPKQANGKLDADRQMSRLASTPIIPKEKPLGWNCWHCSAFMESQWWTCSACGTMKASS